MSYCDDRDSLMKGRSSSLRFDISLQRLVKLIPTFAYDVPANSRTYIDDSAHVDLVTRDVCDVCMTVDL